MRYAEYRDVEFSKKLCFFKQIMILRCDISITERLPFYGMLFSNTILNGSFVTRGLRKHLCHTRVKLYFSANGQVTRMREDFHQEQVAFGAAPAGRMREKTAMMRDRHEDHIPEVIVTKVSIIIGCTVQLAPYTLEIVHSLYLYFHFRKHDVSHSKSLTILLVSCTIIRTKMPASSSDRKWSFYNRMNNLHFCHCQQENQRSQIKLDHWFFYLDQISVLILSK